MLRWPNMPCCISRWKTYRGSQSNAWNPTAWSPSPKRAPAIRNGRAERFSCPPEIAGSAQEALYRETCTRLLDAYPRALETVGNLARTRFPRQAGESDSRWEGRIRSSYVDVCRYLLPAAVLANVGITINARALEHAIRKLLSHPLAEVRAIGAEVKQTALAEVADAGEVRGGKRLSARPSGDVPARLRSARDCFRAKPKIRREAGCA